MSLFDEKYREYALEFDKTLEEFCSKLDCKPQILADSLRYSLSLGGKRVRPVLTFAAADLLGLEHEKVINFALALELIHTYSLIHDDLPEMDNDDFRRGKPSNHKVFGVGNAVLAGDGLLNTAYAVLLSECNKGKEYISAAEYVCNCAGIYGMIAGQSADLLHENDERPSEKVLNFIYENKTGKLLTAPLAVASILSGGKYFYELESFGKNLGYLFQLTDDILDVEGSFDKLGKSIGKDDKEGKYTAVALYGIEECKINADLVADKCRGILEAVEGDTQFLLDTVDFVRYRNA